MIEKNAAYEAEGNDGDVGARPTGLGRHRLLSAGFIGLFRFDRPNGHGRPSRSLETNHAWMNADGSFITAKAALLHQIQRTNSLSPARRSPLSRWA
jgi:hypothetical protein